MPLPHQSMKVRPLPPSARTLATPVVRGHQSPRVPVPDQGDKAGQRPPAALFGCPTVHSSKRKSSSRPHTRRLLLFIMVSNHGLGASPHLKKGEHPPPQPTLPTSKNVSPPPYPCTTRPLSYNRKTQHPGLPPWLLMSKGHPLLPLTTAIRPRCHALLTCPRPAPLRLSAQSV